MHAYSNCVGFKLPAMMNLRKTKTHCCDTIIIVNEFKNELASAADNYDGKWFQLAFLRAHNDERVWLHEHINRCNIAKV